MTSHRESRRWKRLSRTAIGKVLRLRDNGWPRYSAPKRSGRWFWGAAA